MLPLIPMAIAAASGLLGQLLAGKSREEAAALLAEVRDDFGRLDPAKVQKLVAEQVSPDAQYDSAMRGSMFELDNEIDAKGLGVQDQAELNDALDRTGRQERAQRAHILADQEARGAGGSSQSLLAQLVNQQGGAERAQAAGLDTAANAQRRYWQSVRDRFSMGAQGADQRSAVDRWNATQRTNTAQGNNALAQQDYDNRFRQTAAKAGVTQQMANRKDQSADATQQMFGQLGEAAGQGALLYGLDAEEKKKKGLV